MKRSLKKIRDSPFVLAPLIAGLRAARALGLFRSRTLYSHVPYRGIVSVDCGNGARFRIHSAGHNIENGLFWDGLYAHEPKTMACWFALARDAGCVLDIGANSGVFALAASAAGARTVHAFEPLPRVFNILAGNVGLNDFPALHAWPIGVGAESGTADLYDPGGDAPTSASLSAAFSVEHFGQLPTTKVRVVSIDDFCDEQGIDEVALVKIDVEGYEAFALRGMQRTILRSHPYILLEVLEGQEEELRNVVESLWPGLYQWSAIDEGPGHISRNVMLEPLFPVADQHRRTPWR